MIVSNPKDIDAAFASVTAKVTAPAVPPVEVKEEPPVAVTAKLRYDVVGVCPYCKKPMGTTEACGQKVYLCNDDRFVSPLPNADLPESSE